MNDQDRLQKLLGPDYDVSGTRKLHVRGKLGKTVGTYDPGTGRISGYAEVKIYGYDRASNEQLCAVGQAEVGEHSATLEALGLEVDFESATVDPLGLSELTNSADGANYMYVVDLRKVVDGVEEAAEVLRVLAQKSLRFIAREEEAV